MKDLLGIAMVMLVIMLAIGVAAVAAPVVGFIVGIGLAAILFWIIIAG